MKTSDYLIKKCLEHNIDTAFVVTGGAAMHLNDSIGKSKLNVIYMHHEQACAIAAEAYARVYKKPALVCVTAGPGAINSLNGVFGAFTDSLPMVIISGQAKTETSNNFRKIKGLRQLGDQEIDITSMIKKITKSSLYAKNSSTIVKNIDQIIFDATNLRPGPVWLDVPIDVQSSDIKKYNVFNKKKVKIKTSKIILKKILILSKLIKRSQKPIIIAGSGINISNTKSELTKFIKTTNIPIVTAWAHDTYNNFDKFYMGRQGTIGNRAGNFCVQNSDLVIVLGSRLNIRQISYNYKSFAKSAKIVWVDIDKNEFKKKYVTPYLKINCGLNIFFNNFIKIKTIYKEKKGWLKWCNYIKKNFTPKTRDYKIYQNRINIYHFINELFSKLNNKNIVVCADGAATVVPSQIGYLKKDIQLIYNSGCASMGYDLPAAIGVGINSSKKIICLAGDGSIMMNLQELQTIKKMNLNVIIFVLNNDGYLSIKQTQKNFFGNEFGSSPKSKLSFPNFKKISNSFGIKNYTINLKNYKKKISKILNKKGPILCEIKLDTKQEFEPKLKSKFFNGKIITPELDDMYPFLDRKIFKNINEKLIEYIK